MAHNERCRDCKETVRAMLERIYGTVLQNHKVHLATLPEDYRDTPFYPALSSIYRSLQQHRNVENFIRAGYVDIDFYVPEPGFAVEFDESQHFTLPRHIALEAYPPRLKGGYSVHQWKTLCEEIDAHDNDPPYRDEQRAWYDTLRDFLPEIKGSLPTVRLYAGERVWCQMDPEKEEDVEAFKKYISERQKHTTIEVLSDPDPKFARMIIGGPWEGDLTRAKALMEDIIRQWPTTDHVAFFVTPGAFLRFPWPEHFPAVEDNLHPPEESLTLLRDAARKFCEQFLDEKLRTDLASHADYLTIGIDSEDRRYKNGYQVEFVALVDLKTNQYFWTGKSYPDTPQEHRLIRVSDLSTHFVQIPMGKVMVLGCHDLKLFSNRGRVAAGKVQENTWRKAAHKEIDLLIAQEKPVIILQHPHTTDRYGSWYAEWNELASRCPSEVMYISAGLYYYYGAPCRSSLADVRKYTRRGTSVDFIVYPDGVEHQDNATNTGDLPENNSPVYAEKKIHADHQETYCPEFEAVIEAYRQLAGPLFRKGGTRNKFNYIVKLKKTPPGVLYFFCHFPEIGKFSVELNVNEVQAPRFIPTIRNLNKKQFVQLPASTFTEQKTKDGTWLRLQFFYPDDTPPLTVARGMFDLIDQSYPEILRDEQQM
jgi:hypothetical protein